MVRVKICGLTREQDVRAAIDAGADAVGFVVGFQSSPRNLTMERATQLTRMVPPFVDSVLVTTLRAVEENLPSVKGARPDAIQLYTESVVPEGLRDSLGADLIRPYLLESHDARDAVRAAAGFDALLTDTFLPGRQGGTGMVSDWEVCKQIRSTIAPLPLVLSGGLNPENVVKAVKLVRPYAVDASSGVERTPGIKDHGKVAEFIRRAKGGI